MTTTTKASETLGQWAARHGYSAADVVALAARVGRDSRKVAAHAANAKADNDLYVGCFGAMAAAADVPVSAPLLPPRTAAATVSQAEADALYEQVWGAPTPDAPDELYDSLWGKQE
jgi:hypothetical protein